MMGVMIAVSAGGVFVGLASTVGDEIIGGGADTAKDTVEGVPWIGDLIGDGSGDESEDGEEDDSLIHISECNVDPANGDWAPFTGPGGQGLSVKLEVTNPESKAAEVNYARDHQGNIIFYNPDKIDGGYFLFGQDDIEKEVGGSLAIYPETMEKLPVSLTFGISKDGVEVETCETESFIPYYSGNPENLISGDINLVHHHLGSGNVEDSPEGGIVYTGDDEDQLEYSNKIPNPVNWPDELEGEAPAVVDVVLERQDDDGNLFIGVADEVPPGELPDPGAFPAGIELSKDGNISHNIYPNGPSKTWIPKGSWSKEELIHLQFYIDQGQADVGSTKIKVSTGEKGDSGEWDFTTKFSKQHDLTPDLVFESQISQVDVHIKNVSIYQPEFGPE